MSLLDIILRWKEFINKLKRKGAWLPLIKFAIPFIIAAEAIGIMYLTLDRTTFAKLAVAMSAYFFPPAGKESVIPLAVRWGVHPALVASSIILLDVVAALFLVWNFDFTKKVPLVGGAIELTEDKGRRVLEKRTWVRRFAFTGLVLFVMVPFQGSGAVVASILGRIIGMDPYKVFIAITTGSVIGCFSVAYLADIVVSAFKSSFTLGVCSLLVCILAFGIAYVVYRKKRGENAPIG
jgi:uncharacterized membrane protein